MNPNDQKSSVSSRYAQSSVRASCDLLYSTLFTVYALATLLIFVPRSYFEGQSFTNWVTLITEAWPKMAVDAQWLRIANSSFVNKYVTSISIIIAVSSVLFFLGSLRLAITAALSGDMFTKSSKSFDTAKYYAVLISSLIFLIYWNFILPTPFRSGEGFSTRYPASEVAFIYWAALLSGLYFVSVCFVSAVAVGVGRHVRN